MIELKERMFGTFAGIVVSLDDPLKLGRIQVRVPTVFGPMGSDGGQAVPDSDLPWALQTGVPGGQSKESGGMQFLPNKGDRVFVRFLDGEPEKPLWEWAMQDPDRQTPINSYGGSSPSRRATFTRFGHIMEMSPTQTLLSTSKGYSLTFVDGGSPGNFSGAPAAGGAPGGSSNATQPPVSNSGGTLQSGGHTRTLPNRNSDGSISTKSTIFGLNYNGSRDRTDNQEGSASVGPGGGRGYNTGDPNLVGVSIPRGVAVQQFGSVSGARGQYVEVTNESTGAKTVAQIVDIGPNDTYDARSQYFTGYVPNVVANGRALDLTYGATQQLGIKDDTNVSYRFVGSDPGNPVAQAPQGPVPTQNGVPSPNMPPPGSGSSNPQTGQTGQSQQNQYDGYFSLRSPKGNVIEMFDDTDHLQINVNDLYSSRFQNLKFMGDKYDHDASTWWKVKSKDLIDMLAADDFNITSNGDHTVKIKSDMEKTVGGDFDETITGDFTHIAGSIDISSKAAYDLTISGVSTMKHQVVSMTSTVFNHKTQAFTLDASTVDFSSVATLNMKASAATIAAGDITMQAGGRTFTMNGGGFQFS